MDYASFYEEHLGKIKWGAKGEGMARCPFHEDKTASLGVNRWRGVWFCHACGIGGTARQFAERLGVEPPPRRGTEPERIHEYTDEKGARLFREVRMPGRRYYLQRYAGAERWEKGLGETRRVLYRLPKLVASTGLVLVPEGPKDVESLERLGFTATTNPMGAGKWLREYNEYFRGKRVVILADNDAPGRRHAHDVARNLHGIAASVKVIEFPELPEHGDVSDAIARGLTREQLLARIAETPEWSEALAPLVGAEGQTLAAVVPDVGVPGLERLRLPSGYTVREGRLYEEEGSLITGTPLLPFAELLELETGDRSFECLLLGTGEPRRLPIAAQDIRDTRRVLTLTRHGLDVDSFKARGLVHFVSDFLHANSLERVRETRRFGWARWKGGAAYVLHESYPPGAGVRLVADTQESRDLLEALRPAGSLAGVRELVELIAAFPIPVATVCASIAPAVREILELEARNFVLHLEAESGSGKSVAQQIGLSAWARAVESPWLAHGHATFAGMERVCQRSYGLPVFAEDAHLMSERDKPFFIMAVGNEMWKFRGGEHAGRTLPWHGVPITSGELGLLDETSLEGVGARCISLVARPFGEHSDKTHELLERRVLPLIREHHGLLGPLLVNRLLQASAEERRELRAWWAGCRDRFHEAAAGNRTLARQAPVWGLLALAGRLVAKALSLEGEPSLVDQVWEAFGVAQRIAPPDPVREAYEYLLSWAASHRPFFYVRSAAGTSGPGEGGAGAGLPGIGEEETGPERGRPIYGLINERLGWIAFFPNVVRDVLEHARLGGAQRFSRAWAGRGWLKCQGDRLTHNVKVGGAVRRFYVLTVPEAQEGPAAGND